MLKGYAVAMLQAAARGKVMCRWAGASCGGRAQTWRSWATAQPSTSAWLQQRCWRGAASRPPSQTCGALALLLCAHCCLSSSVSACSQPACVCSQAVHPCPAGAPSLLLPAAHTQAATCRFCKPLDGKLVRQLAANHPVIITVEEGSIGGFGSHGAHLSSALGALHRTRPAALWFLLRDPAPAAAV